MKGYVIKVTYLTGRHKGKTYLMKKGGYVTEENHYHFESDIYKTLGIAKRVCTMYRKNNERDYNAERRMNEYNILKGRPAKDGLYMNLNHMNHLKLNIPKIFYKLHCKWNKENNYGN